LTFITTRSYFLSLFVGGIHSRLQQ